ncbi:hypothetical protein FC35_GL000747 [Limosilactobacillus coleohominis DSM 14060]|nr:hypothetical protein FC35_GL000747 [Limosilactobacillus coleohominis DSM 14060]
MERANKRFDWAAFILGVLLVILGCVSMYHIDKTLRLVAILMGIGAIVKGIYEIWLRQTVNNLLNHRSAWLLIMAILDIYCWFDLPVCTGRWCTNDCLPVCYLVHY